MSDKVIYKAKEAWRLLNGVFCVYRPRDVPIPAILAKIRANLVRDLNSLHQPPMRMLKKPLYKFSESNQKMVLVGSENVIDYSQHPLVCGPHYRPQDIELEALGTFQTSKDDPQNSAASGVTLIGVNEGIPDLESIKLARYVSLYSVVGKLGKATSNLLLNGRVKEKSTIDHVNLGLMNKVLTQVQNAAQPQALASSGKIPNSIDAYELASKGAVRPAEDSTMIFYAIRCVKYRKPWFNLEMELINETEEQIYKFISKFGVSLKTTACTAKLRRIRCGHFSADMALLDKYWNLENILNNIQVCGTIVDSSKLLPSQTLGEDPVLLPAHSHPPLITQLRSISEELPALESPTAPHYLKGPTSNQPLISAGSPSEQNDPQQQIAQKTKRRLRNR